MRCRSVSNIAGRQISRAYPTSNSVVEVESRHPDDGKELTVTATAPTPTRATTAATSYLVFVGLAGLAVLLQGLWAGIFLETDGARDEASRWIDVHARGSDVAISLAALATVVAFLWLRDQADLWIVSALLTTLMLTESYLGGLIRDDSQDALTAVHIPLAMIITSLVVYLVFRGMRTRSGIAGSVRTK